MKNKAVKGFGWSIIDNVADTGITFIVGLVLARLLTPDEYGLIGIVLIFLTIFNGIIDSGFSNALIRKIDADDRDYNTAFITNLVISIGLFILLFVCAPVISLFFRRSELTPLLRVMGSVLIINAVSLVHNAILTKRIDFKTKTKASIISSAISGIIGIGMALLGFGVWSLVTQQLSRQFCNSLCLCLYSRWIPSFKFYAECFRGLWSFGWKLLVIGIIDNLWREIYQVVIGRCYSAETLGQYTRAKQFSSISGILNYVVQRVTYPILSGIQNEKERLKNAYKRVIKGTMLISFLVMFLLAAIAKPMIIVLIGEKWIPAAYYLQIICFQAVLFPLNALNLNMLQVIGESGTMLKLELIKKLICIIPIILGIIYGIYWLLLGSVIIGIITYFINASYSGNPIDYGVMEQIRDILPSLFVSLFCALIVYAISFIPLSSTKVLIIQLLVWTIVTFLILELLKLPEYLEVKSAVINLIKHKA